MFSVRSKKKPLHNQPGLWRRHFIAGHFHMGWLAPGRDLLLERHTLRFIIESVVSPKHNCLEQSARQLCFNKHYEKTSSYWMPHLHHCLPVPISDSYSRTIAIPNSDGFSHADTFYHDSRTNCHFGTFSHSISTLFHR